MRAIRRRLRLPVLGGVLLFAGGCGDAALERWVGAGGSDGCTFPALATGAAGAGGGGNVDAGGGNVTAVPGAPARPLPVLLIDAPEPLPNAPTSMPNAPKVKGRLRLIEDHDGTLKDLAGLTATLDTPPDR